MKTIITATLILLAPGLAIAEVDGNWFYGQCKEPTGFGTGICMGFVAGFSEGVDLQARVSGKKPLTCVPDQVTNQQKTDVFIKYLRDNPKQRHKLPAVLVAESFIDAWPCK